MTSKINALSTGVGGLATSADASGILELQTNDTTAVTIDASQNVTFANTATATAFVGDGSGLTNLPIPPAGVTSLNGETGAIVNTNYGEVGTYLFGLYYGLGITENTLVAGSSLQPAGIHGGGAPPSNDGFSNTVSFTRGGSALAGTWRSMGRHAAGGTSALSRILLWVRVS